MTAEDIESEVCDSVTQVIEGYIMPRVAHEATPVQSSSSSFPSSSSASSSQSSSMNTTAFPSAHSTVPSSLHSVDSVTAASSSSSSSSTARSYDRRARSMKFEAECQMTSEVSNMTNLVVSPPPA